MTIILEKPEFFIKDQDNLLKISRLAIKAIPKVSSHPYFRKVKNWKHIIFNYASLPENQMEVVLFDGTLAEPTGNLRVSPKARNQFNIDSVVLHDFDNGWLTLQREDLDSNEFDFIFDSRYQQPILVATLNNKSQADLNWSVAENTGPSTEYSIYKKTGSGPYYLLTTVTGLLEYSDTGLLPEVTYTYKLQINDPLLYLPMINEESVTPQSPEPASNLVATGSPGQITLNWSPSISPNVTYKMYRSTVSNGQTVPLISNLTGTSFIDNTIVDGTQYFYRVKCDDGFESVFSNEATFKTIGSFSVTNFSAIDEMSATVSWSTALGAHSYDIYYKKDSDPSYTILLSKTSPHIITGLEEGSIYNVYIHAMNPFISRDSASSQANIPIMPETPTGLATISYLNQKVDMTWDSMLNADKYYIYRSTALNGSYTKITESTTTSYSNTGLNNGTEYYYKISSVNVAGVLTLESPKCSAVSGLPFAPTAFITLSTAADPSSDWNIGSYKFTASSNLPAGSVSYFEIYTFNSAGVQQNMYTSALNDMAFETPFITIARNTEYAAYTRAYLTSGAMIQSSTQYMRSAANPPTGLAVVSTSVCKLTWVAAAGNNFYWVDRKTTNPPKVGDSITSTGGLNYTDSTSPNSILHYYDIRAENRSAWAGAVIGLTPKPTSGSSSGLNDFFTIISARSNVASGTRTPLVAPTDLVADTGVNSNTNIISWTPVAGAERYILYSSTDPSFSNAQSTIVYSLVMTGLRGYFTISAPGNIVIYYRVKADDLYTYSGYSNVDDATANPSLTAPVITTSNNTIRVIDGIYSNVDLELQYGTTDSFGSFIYPVSDSVFSGFTQNTKYYFRYKDRISGTYSSQITRITYPDGFSFSRIMNSTALRSGESVNHSPAAYASHTLSTGGMTLNTTNQATVYNDIVRARFLDTVNNLLVSLVPAGSGTPSITQYVNIDVTFQIIQSNASAGNYSSGFHVYLSNVGDLGFQAGGGNGVYILSAQPQQTQSWPLYRPSGSQAHRLVMDSFLYSFPSVTNKIKIISWTMSYTPPVL